MLQMLAFIHWYQLAVLVWTRLFSDGIAKESVEAMRSYFLPGIIP